MAKFNIICADCPWVFDDKLTMSEVSRGAESNYPTLNKEEIKKLKIDFLAEDDALLALWVPSTLIQDGLDTLKAWKFNFKQIFVWVKTIKTPHYSKVNDSILAFGMGRLFRQCHEICLIGIRGKIYNHLKNKSQRSVCFDQNLKHSEKPELLQERLELMFPNLSYLELFARRERKGWVCVGNESPSSMGEDIRDSIDNLLEI